jgi:hypothetical protein
MMTQNPGIHASKLVNSASASRVNGRRQFSVNVSAAVQGRIADVL